MLLGHLPAVRLRLLSAICLAFFLNACTEKSETKTEAAKGADPARGRRVYLANCIACHAFDPAKDGSIGPAVHGASESLLQVKILTGRYPAGYTPKRKTQAMPLYSYLKSEIRHLAAFLAESGKPSG